MSKDLRINKGFGYADTDTGTICMIRCFECGRENYAMAVSSGYCAFCGFDPNKGIKDEIKKVTSKNGSARKSVGSS